MEKGNHPDRPGGDHGAGGGVCRAVDPVGPAARPARRRPGGGERRAGGRHRPRLRPAQGERGAEERGLLHHPDLRPGRGLRLHRRDDAGVLRRDQSAGHGDVLPPGHPHQLQRPHCGPKDAQRGVQPLRPGGVGSGRAQERGVRAGGLRPRLLCDDRLAAGGGDGGRHRGRLV